MSVYTQTAQRLFDTFHPRPRCDISGTYGDIIYARDLRRFEIVSHGTTLAELSRLFAKVDLSFTYCYADGEGNATGEQIPLTASPYYEEVYFFLSSGLSAASWDN